MINKFAIKFDHNDISTVTWSFEEFVRTISDHPNVRFVIDSNAAWYYRETIKEILPTTIEWVFEAPNESKKSQHTVEQILEFLFNTHADRKCLLVAIGGGITLDIAGYSASIYKRGIEWAAVPTTLLAQVDASVGGKTGINHPKYGKNVIGSFHPPQLVLIDSSCSGTWNEELRLEGIAEIYKIFKVFDHVSSDQFLKMGLSLKLVQKSVELKAKVVNADPYEANIRAALNYGHTVGHAIEALMNNESNARLLPHGIAVAIGIRIENEIAHEIGIMSLESLLRINSELDELGFKTPKTLPDAEEIVKLMYQDKKSENNTINIVCIDGTSELKLDGKDPRIKIQPSTVHSAIATFELRRNVQKA